MQYHFIFQYFDTACLICYLIAFKPVTFNFFFKTLFCMKLESYMKVSEHEYLNIPKIQSKTLF